jgi:hypothetical protein
MTKIVNLKALSIDHLTGPDLFSLCVLILVKLHTSYPAYRGNITVEYVLCTVWIDGNNELEYGICDRLSRRSSGLATDGNIPDSSASVTGTPDLQYSQWEVCLQRMVPRLLSSSADQVIKVLL